MNVLEPSEAQAMLYHLVQRSGSYRKAEAVLDLSYKHIQDMVKGRRPISRYVLNQLGLKRLSVIVRGSATTA